MIPENARLTCPLCGNTKPRHIRELDDRTRVLYFSKACDGGTMYAKKYHCTDCGYEWLK